MIIDAPNRQTPPASNTPSVLLVGTGPDGNQELVSPADLAGAVQSGAELTSYSGPRTAMQLNGFRYVHDAGTTTPADNDNIIMATGKGGGRWLKTRLNQAADVVTDAQRRFVSDEQIATWTEAANRQTQPTDAERLARYRAARDRA